MGYALPSNTSYVSCSWQCHRNRPTPSTEPGTDYASAFGSPLYAVGAGRVVDVKRSNSGATGRYVTIDLDDGRRTRSLHVQEIWVSVGQRVGRGQQIGKTGASGFGSDWYYGPHVHQTLWAGWYYAFGPNATIDFAPYVGPVDPPKPPPPPPPPPPPTEEEEIMGAVDTLLSAIRREQRWRQFSDTSGTLQALGRPGRVIRLSPDPKSAMTQKQAIASANALLLPPDEIAGTLPVLDPTAFYTLVDNYDPGGDHGFGKFVRNTFDLTGGSTKMHRKNPDTVINYATRQLVWANMEPVELFYREQPIVQLQIHGKAYQALLADGRTVVLTQTEVDRANAQKPAGQTWVTV